MPKRSKRHTSRYEKNDAGGCISGLMNIFEFRHHRLNRKLLSDIEPGSKQHNGLGSSNERPTLQNSTKKKGKNPKNLEDIKTSVKKLMEDDMVDEQFPDKPSNVSRGNSEELNSNCRNVRNGSRRRNRTSRTSVDMDLCDEDSLKIVVPKYLSQELIEHKSSETSNLQTLIEELSKIQSNSTEFTSDDLDQHVEQNLVVIPEKLSAAIKVIISERHLEQDDKTSHSNEFMDALEMINSNKQVLLKLLEDSNPQLVKQMEGSERASLKNDQKSNSLRMKHRNFFRKRSKSLDSNPLEGEEKCNSSSKIVILKPGLAGSRFLDNGSSKVEGDRHSSHFFFAEIKRRLQNAMGKDHRGDSFYRYSEHNNKGDGGDNLGWRSPNRNHFYTEVFAKPSPSFRRDNISKSNDVENAITKNNSGVSNIYIEAKKHLSEMLNAGEDNPDSVQKQSPKSLGGILSLPAYKDLSTWSHEKDTEDSFVTARSRLSSTGPPQGVNHSPQHVQDEGHGYISSSEKSIDNQIDTISEIIHENGHSPDSNCIATYEETTVFIEDVISPKNSLEIAESAPTSIQEDDKILDDVAVSVNMVPDKEDVGDDNAGICNENPSSKCSDSDSIEDGQQSPSVSSTVNAKVEDDENVSDRTNRKSPISVLEPLFSDDDISPRRPKDRQIGIEIRPQKIHFVDERISVSGVGINTMSVLEDGESPFDYVEAVLLGSDLNWDDFLERWLSSDQILDPTVFQEVELFSSRHNDQKLLFDCTNEILKEVCDRYFGCYVGASSNRQSIQQAPTGMNLINEIWEGVEWCLFQHLPSKSLDQLVGSDMKISRIWMDFRVDTEHIGIEIEAAILEKLLEDIVGSFLDDNLIANPGGPHETDISIHS